MDWYKDMVRCKLRGKWSKNATAARSLHISCNLKLYICRVWWKVKWRDQRQNNTATENGGAAGFFL